MVAMSPSKKYPFLHICLDNERYDRPKHPSGFFPQLQYVRIPIDQVSTRLSFTGEIL